MLLGIASVAIGYLLGSLPAAYIMAKLRKGIDIREVGVRNMGAGSVFREVGIWEGAVVAIVDIGKGSAAVLIAQALEVTEPWMLGAGLAAILGHNYPVFIGFRGGRGVATLIGVMLVISPVIMVVILPIIGVGWLVLRHMFTIIALVAPLFLLVTWLVERSYPLLLYAFIIIAFIIFRSRNRFREIAPALGKFKKTSRSKP